MIKKAYIQPTVKEIKVNIPAVLAAASPSGNQDPETETYFDPTEETTDND